MTNPRDYSVVGYLANGKVLALHNDTRQNLLLLGEIGSGKTSIIRLLIHQDIVAKRGFLLAENHSDLSREVLSMIPKSEYHKIVYVSLGSVRKFEKTLRFNPLEISDPYDSGIVALNFTESLAKAFSDSWGQRVETCARNGALAVLGTQSNTIGTMLRLLTERNFCESFIPSIPNRSAKDFFSTVYWKQYPAEAGGVIFNKISKMLTIPEMDAMFNTEKSSVSFADMIDRGMYVILDFYGVPNDMVQFLGNVFLHMFYIQYKKRARNKDGKFTTFNLYLDEAQTFSHTMLRELLNTVRKYGIKATIATQSTSALEKELSDEIMTLCRSVACFRCDAATALTLKSILPVKPEAQQQMSFHHFSFYSAGDRPLKAIAKTKHMAIPDRSEQAAFSSVDMYGTYVSLDKYYMSKGGNAEVRITPLEFGILNLLRMENRDMTKDEIIEKMLHRFATTPRDVASALQDTLISANGFVAKKDVKSDDGDHNFESRYVITNVATKTIFSKAASGRRAGSDLHLSTIFMVMDIQVNLGNYCIPDLGAGSAKHADLLVFSPKQASDGPDSQPRYNPIEWSDKVTALEVEVDPAKHWNQAYTNWEKSTKLGYSVWFIVYTQKLYDNIIYVLNEKGVSPENYVIQLFDQNTLLASKTSATLAVFTEIETAIMKLMIDTGRNATQKYIIDSLWNFEKKDITDTLESMEKEQVLKANSDFHALHTIWSLAVNDVPRSMFGKATTLPSQLDPSYDIVQNDIPMQDTVSKSPITCDDVTNTDEKDVPSATALMLPEETSANPSTQNTKTINDSINMHFKSFSDEQLLSVWNEYHKSLDPYKQNISNKVTKEVKRRKKVIAHSTDGFVIRRVGMV